MITSNDHHAYRQELSALEKACAQVQNVAHLIKLLLTFKHKERYYLLFEWADGNLRDLWEQKAVQDSPAFTSEWLAEQCLGLSRAVQSIQGLTTWQIKKREDSESDEQDWGRHGDIKPNNILWFSKNNGNSNVLVISDLGLTRYHSRLSKSMIDPKHLEGYTWSYRAPEVDLLGLITPKFDIWSLGCVFLEVMIWYLQGKDALFSFEEERFNEDHPTFRGVQEDKFFNVSVDTDDSKRASVKLAIGKV